MTEPTAPAPEPTDDTPEPADPGAQPCDCHGAWHAVRDHCRTWPCPDCKTICSRIEEGIR